LPQEWATDEARRKQAHVPATVKFQTKAELTLALLDEATACGVRHSCVTCDADYGYNPHFLNGLEACREYYVAAVRASFSMTLGRGQTSSVLRADAVMATQSRQAWQTIAWSAGAKGWWRAKFCAPRCWRVDGDGRRHVGWLIGQRPGRGQQGDWKYFWSDFPVTTPLATMVEYAHRRHWVEQYHEEAKTELGWDQYQGRRWDGFHRHAITVMLSYSFLVWLEVRQRQQRRVRGRLRAAFSPTPGPPADAVATGPSPAQ
jgi:SRSO17 transposase